MPGPEQNLWKWLKRESQPLVAIGDLHMCRVENSVGLGYPDVEGCYNGCGFNVELKAVARPKRKTTKIKVRFEEEQIPWLRKRWNVGGSCWVLLRVGSGRSARHYLIPGIDAGLLQEGLTESQINHQSRIASNCLGIQVIPSVCRSHLY